jgi:PAS domain S-box-containing protein
VQICELKCELFDAAYEDSLGYKLTLCSYFITFLILKYTQTAGGISMKNKDHVPLKNEDISIDQNQTTEIRHLNEKLTLANEELRITNEELKAYKNQLEKLVSIRAQEIQKKEESLKYKNRLEKLIAGISTSLFNLSPELVDSCIVKSLQEIGEFLMVDAVFLAEIFYSENVYGLTHIWKKDEIRFDCEFFKRAPLSDIMPWLEKIHDQEIFIVEKNVLSNNDQLLREKVHFKDFGVIAFIPIIYQGNIVGITGLSSSKKNYSCDPDEVSLLQQVGQLFVSALKRKKSEKILIESERNYREIFNATSEAIIIYDYDNSQIIDVNQAAMRLFGLSYEEALLGHVEEFSNIDEGYNRDALMKHIERAIHEGPVVFEWQIRRKDGEIMFTEVSMKNTEIGGEMRIVGVVRDISERKRDQKIIVQREERFRSIIQFLTDIIWILDKDIRITFESPSSNLVLGYEPGYLIGKSGFDVIHPDDLPLVKKELQEVFLKQNDFLPSEFRVKSKSGQWISLEVIANNMLDHPAIQGIIITCRDITERKRVEKALKISETKFRNIFNNSSDAIVIISNKYDFLEVNNVFLKATGYSLEETHRLKATDLITDSYLPQLGEHLVKILRNEYLPALECEIKCKSKSIYPAEINSKLIDFEGEQALISVIRDITERKHLEGRILDTIISTEEKEREKFARNLHDELGPLLSSIKMYVHSLSSSTEESKHNFIISQLKIILDDVIQSTKELSNDLSPHILANYGLISALEWFINQLKPYIAITLESNLNEERYSSSVELSIYRIIKELINNTVKHAQASKVNIRLYLILKNIHLNYSDNGIGFNEEWQNNYDQMGMGMSNILSRARFINATCKFFNNAPNGMSFEMQVPVEEHGL